MRLFRGVYPISGLAVNKKSAFLIMEKELS